MNIKPDDMLATAQETCRQLRAIANPHRLVMLCQLVEGEKSVGEMAEYLGIRDSTVSQNLALLRASGIVAARREAQTMWYSIKSEQTKEILRTLYHIYCSSKPLCTPSGKSVRKKKRNAP